MNAPLHQEVPPGVLNDTQALSAANEAWDSDIVGQLMHYAAIPAKSPGFEANWVQHGTP